MKPAHGGNIYDFDGEVLDFSSNINPLGPPPQVKEMLRGSSALMEKYPDIKYRRLRAGLAEWEGVSPGQILVGNGAGELIYLLAELFRGRKAVLPVPTFSEYQAALESRNCQVKLVRRREEDDFELPLSRLRQEIKEEEAAGTFICRPNNPDGSLLTRRRLKPLLSETEYLISDESFLEYLGPDNRESLLVYLEEFPGLVVLRSLTKFYALPGLRLGYLIASRRLVDKIADCQPPWPVNALAAAAGRLIPDCSDYQRKSLQKFRQAKGIFQEGLEKLPGVKVYPGQANFFLCHLSVSQAGVAELQESLVDRGFLIRNCASFAGLNEQYFRVAVRSQQDNEKLLSALKSALKNVRGERISE